MRSEEEIRERISYFQQCIIKDVTEGLISIEQLKYYRTAIEILRDVLQENNQ
jgi:hypothetical protein